MSTDANASDDDFWKDLFAAYDENKDNVISKEEFVKHNLTNFEAFEKTKKEADSKWDADKAFLDSCVSLYAIAKKFRASCKRGR